MESSIASKSSRQQGKSTNDGLSPSERIERLIQNEFHKVWIQLNQIEARIEEFFQSNSQSQKEASIAISAVAAELKSQGTIIKNLIEVVLPGSANDSTNDSANDSANGTPGIGLALTTITALGSVLPRMEAIEIDSNGKVKKIEPSPMTLAPAKMNIDLSVYRLSSSHGGVKATDPNSHDDQKQMVPIMKAEGSKILGGKIPGSAASLSAPGNRTPTSASSSGFFSLSTPQEVFAFAASAQANGITVARPILKPVIRGVGRSLTLRSNTNLGRTTLTSGLDSLMSSGTAAVLAGPRFPTFTLPIRRLPMVMQTINIHTNAVKQQCGFLITPTRHDTILEVELSEASLIPQGLPFVKIIVTIFPEMTTAGVGHETATGPFLEFNIDQIANFRAGNSRDISAPLLPAAVANEAIIEGYSTRDVFYLEWTYHTGRQEGFNKLDITDLNTYRVLNAVNELRMERSRIVAWVLDTSALNGTSKHRGTLMEVGALAKWSEAFVRKWKEGKAKALTLSRKG